MTHVRQMKAWKWLRSFAIVGWAMSLTAAMLIGDELIRGYGTAWAFAAAFLGWLYVVGMLRFSRTWRAEIGAVVFVLVLQIAMVMTLAWATRVFLSPPANPNVGNAILYIDLAWTLFWLLSIFVLRQIVARRKVKDGN